MINIQKNIFLKNYTTFKIGGEAEFFVEAKSLDELKSAIIWAREKFLPVFILGGGSNLLVSNKKFNGLVIKIKNEKSRDVDLSRLKNNFVWAEAGINLNFLIKKSLENNLIGLENLAGIPGTLGGAVRGNAGAWGSSISEFIEEVGIFDLEKMELKIFFKKEFKFNYRDSIFKHNKNLIIWAVKLKLKIGTDKELKSAQEIMQKNLKQRIDFQPSEPSAGCVFKNIKNLEFGEFLRNNPQVKLLEKFLENKVVPAAWLIEECELKGQKMGGAQVSDQHANFIINKNSATADDVIKLISLIKTHVRDKFGVQLETEIELVNF